MRDHAVEQGADVTIVSSDKDLMQLIRPGIKMWDPMKNRPIGAAEVQEKFGVGPDKVIDVQALCGDSTDNVPGVPGIGVKTAAELINTYGDLETLLTRATEIKQPKRRESLIDQCRAGADQSSSWSRSKMTCRCRARSAASRGSQARSIRRRCSPSCATTSSAPP